jgi:hypothetical protein
MIASVFEEVARQLSTIGAAYVAGPTAVVPATAALPEGLGTTLGGPPERQLNIAAWEVAGRLSFVFSIQNTQSGQTIYVRDLLKALKQPFSYDDFKFDANLGTLESQQIARRMVSAVLANPKVVEILRGKEWLDVSFDWAGMR